MLKIILDKDEFECDNYYEPKISLTLDFSNECTSYQILSNMIKLLNFDGYSFDKFFMQKLSDFCVDEKIIPNQVFTSEENIEL